MMHGPINVRCRYLCFCIFDLGDDNAKRYSELLFCSRFTFSVPNTLTAGLNGEGTLIFGSDSNFLPVDTVSIPRRIESSATHL